MCLPQVGYPADKPQGTMWLSQCQSVAFDYDGNQGVFKDVSQCTDEARTRLPHRCPDSDQGLHANFAQSPTAQQQASKCSLNAKRQLQ